MFKWGIKSKERMIGVDEFLIECATRALAKSNYDMTIPWMGGVRTAKEQNALFVDGNTKADGYARKSYHQSGMALDVVPVDGNYTNTKAFNHFAKLMFSTWQVMIYNKEARGLLYWGGHFGKNGWDKPHYEIR